MVHRPHQVHELAVHDPDELLRRIERLEHPPADRVGQHPLEELVGHVVGDVGLEQGRAHGREALAHVRLGELAAAAQ